MQNRWGTLRASPILGIVWAMWHTLSVIPLRILTVWIYNNAGKSVFAVILFHDVGNISWSLFPN